MFSIPNVADAAFSFQAGVDSRDIDALVAAAQGHGVIQGCAVTAQGSPNMTVAVAIGTIQVSGRFCREVAAGNVTIGAANATNPRFDLIVADKTGAKQCRAGTAAANPVFPTLTAGDVLLAAVYVPANDTAIDANQIIDKRCILSPQTVAAPGCARVYTDFSAFTNPSGNVDWDAQFTSLLNSGATVQMGTGGTQSLGVVDLHTNTTTGANATIRTADTAFLLGNGYCAYAVALVTPASLSDGTTRYAIRAGIWDASPNAVVDGVYFTYSDFINSGKWQCVCVANSVATTADSGITVAASTRYLLECEIAADGSTATFYINGAQVAQISTNLPITAGRTSGFGIGILNTIGTTDRAVSCDKLDLIYEPLDLY